MIGLDFVVFGKAAGEGKPSESRFDNPPAGQDFEGVSMQVAALDNLDSQTAIGNELLDSSQKLLAKVSGISPKKCPTPIDGSRICAPACRPNCSAACQIA